MFIPATIEEIKKLNWKEIDIILVSGDAYIDNSFNGIAVIGRCLLEHGYRVAIIPQPSLSSDIDIMKFGNPKLFWAVSSGAMDSMVANYTALKKKRQSDDLTPNGINNKRPDRAVIRYVNLIKQYYNKKVPIVIGGIEASLRRVTHYDYWDNALRRPILFDSKADILIYGEGERTIVELANKIKNNEPITEQRGICFPANQSEIETLKNNAVILPSHEETLKDKDKFIELFNTFYNNNDPINSKRLIEPVNNRLLIQNPPNYYLQTEELDKVYNYKYENKAHPMYNGMGKIKALDTIKFSITSHRGCFGECNFCAIAVHFGKTIRSRSEESILKEVKSFTEDPKFKGIIYDVGGASANMYGMTCKQQEKYGTCKNKRCLYPSICKNRSINHSHHLQLLRKIAKNNKIRKIFVSSGIRYDLIMEDKKFGDAYLNYIVANCISGQMKIAPEHTEDKILNLMAKPEKYLQQFYQRFKKISKDNNKKQFLTYYLMAGHPGCTLEDMKNMKKRFSKEFHILPEQIQIFTPTPSTYSTLMYYTNKHYSKNEEVFVEKNLKNLLKQKEIITK